MDESLTEELLERLLASDDPDRFVSENLIETITLGEYLSRILNEKGLVRSEIVRAAGINETFGYQIFMGQRNPSRNKVLQLVFAMGMKLREANRALRLSGASELYCKVRRDAIIIFCLDRGASLHRTNEELFRFGEETIC